MSRWGRHRSRGVIAAGAVAVVAAVAGIAVLIAGRDDADSTQNGEAQPVAYREAVAGTWRRLNPLFAEPDSVDEDVTALVFSSLLRTGPDGAPVPDLAAELPTISEDGLTYVFRLRDATWHDGELLSSADVAFTIAAIQDPDFQGLPELAELWANVTVDTPDPLTVVFQLQQPYAPFAARAATIGILPAHLLGDLSATQLAGSAFNLQPVGSGPFRVESIDSGEGIFSAFEGYYNGEPQLDRIALDFYEDEEGALRAISGGDADALFLRDNVTADTLGIMREVPRTALTVFDGDAYLILYLNNNQAAFFLDPRVRQAISLALNRDSFAGSLFAGLARTSSSAVMPGSWAYEPEYDRTAPNLDEARRLLGDAGWQVSEQSGVLTREGTEFRITLRTDDDPTRVALADGVAEQLGAIGIRATIASTTLSVLESDFLVPREYDAAIAGWDQGPDPDPYAGWHSSQIGSAGLNFASFEDLVVDELITRARTSVDEVVREDFYGQFQEKWDELTPSVVLLYPQYLFAHPDGLEGLTEGALTSPAQRYFGIERWRR